MSRVASPPDVSIVVPCYAHGAELTRGLESIRDQTHGAWECVVVDDGSPTDEAAEAVAILGDDRVRFVKHDTNRGLAAARRPSPRVQWHCSGRHDP